MLPRKFKLIRFHAESLGASTEVPACEDLQIIALLEAEDGATVERIKKIFAYPAVMADAEQFPFQIAAELRLLMLDTPPATTSPSGSGSQKR
jgi:hypothetical protein